MPFYQSPFPPFFLRPATYRFLLGSCPSTVILFSFLSSQLSCSLSSFLSSVVLFFFFLFALLSFKKNKLFIHSLAFCRPPPPQSLITYIHTLTLVRTRTCARDIFLSTVKCKFCLLFAGSKYKIVTPRRKGKNSSSCSTCKGANHNRASALVRTAHFVVTQSRQR